MGLDSGVVYKVLKPTELSITVVNCANWPWCILCFSESTKHKITLSIGVGRGGGGGCKCHPFGQEILCRNFLRDCALIALVYVVASHNYESEMPHFDNRGVGSSVKVGGGGANLIWRFKPEKGGCGKKLRTTVPKIP